MVRCAVAWRRGFSERARRDARDFLLAGRLTVPRDYLKAPALAEVIAGSTGFGISRWKGFGDVLSRVSLHVLDFKILHFPLPTGRQRRDSLPDNIPKNGGMYIL